MAHDLIQHQPSLPAARPRQLPARQLGGAMVWWFAGVFGLCYVALPTALAAVGLHGSVASSVMFNLPGFVLAALAVTAGSVAMRPTIQFDDVDPVLPAAAGGLTVWALAHNVMPGLMAFSEMGAGQLAAFIGVNIIEMTLLGMVLASFTRNKATAFGLGALFQIITFGLGFGLF